MLAVAGLSAQTDSSKSSFSLSGYVDTYFAYYTDSLSEGTFQQFPTVSPISESIGLNIAQLSAKYSAEKLRATVTLHYGDIPLSAWSGNYNFIQEANVGFRICKKLWVDAGFLRTHIGAEGLYPKENIASSISIPTWLEPYYESGLKINYLPTEKLTINLFLLNGYNRFEDNNKKKSAGLQATYIITDQFNIGYTNYFGDDSPTGDSVSHARFFNNLILNYEAGKFKATAGIDFATQQNSSLEDADQSASMFSALLAMRYMICEKFDIYARGEIVNDPDGFLSGTFENTHHEITGLDMKGFTFGAEYKPTENSYLRLEGRQFVADDLQKIFHWDGKNTNTRTEILANLGIWF